MTKVLTILILSLLSACSPSSGAPIASSSAEVVTPIVLHERQQEECTNIEGCRTAQGIVLSCLATVLACTWVAIHPNLPGPRDSEWIKLKRKVLMMIYTTVQPECMTFWALRQRLAAGKIAKEFNRKHGKEDNVSEVFLQASLSAVKEWWQGLDDNTPNVWTLTHGFFIQMGGFLLYDGKVPKRVLTFEDLQELIDNKEVEVPDITERDINGRSKGDFLTKLTVLLQTTWFVLQCVVRWARNLPVTELEVVTFAFAALNVITYALWWKKPQNVEVTTRVQLKPEADRGSHKVGAGARNDNEAEGVHRDDHEAEGVHRDDHEVEEDDKGDHRVEGVDSDHGAEGEDGDGHEAESLTETEELLIGEDKESWIVGELREAMSGGLFGWLIGVPYALLLALWRPLLKIASDDNEDVDRESLRMPMFYAERFKRKDFLPIAAICILFGAFHLIPWSSPFPSTTELWLWRASALFITAHPLMMVASTLAFRLGHNLVGDVLAYIYNWTLLLYAPARLVLLVLAFTTMRHLPSGAYIDIEWTSFVPHF